MAEPHPVPIILDSKELTLFIGYPKEHPDGGRLVYLDLREPGKRGRQLQHAQFYVMRVLIEEGEELYGGHLPNPQDLMVDAAVRFLEWAKLRPELSEKPEKLYLKAEDVVQLRQAAPGWPALRKALMALFVQLDTEHPNISLNAWGLSVMLKTTYEAAESVARGLVQANYLQEIEYKFYRLHPAESLKRERDAEARPAAQQALPPPDFTALISDVRYSDLLTDRWHEAQAMYAAGAWRFTVIALGGLLEGALLARFNREGIAPHGSFKEMIKGAEQNGWLKPYRVQVSHALREYRNYIHPERELRETELIDEGTCKIVWPIIQAAIDDLVKS